MRLCAWEERLIAPYQPLEFQGLLRLSQSTKQDLQKWNSYLCLHQSSPRAHSSPGLVNSVHELRPLRSSKWNSWKNWFHCIFAVNKSLEHFINFMLNTELWCTQILQKRFSKSVFPQCEAISSQYPVTWISSAYCQQSRVSLCYFLFEILRYYPDSVFQFLCGHCLIWPMHCCFPALLWFQKSVQKLSANERLCLFICKWKAVLVHNFWCAVKQHSLPEWVPCACSIASPGCYPGAPDLLANSVIQPDVCWSWQTAKKVGVYILLASMGHIDLDSHQSVHMITLLEHGSWTELCRGPPKSPCCCSMSAEP